jgi:hypothetical protein
VYHLALNRSILVKRRGIRRAVPGFGKFEKRTDPAGERVKQSLAR